MIKKMLYIILIAGILTNTCSCALLRKPIDNRTGFSMHLKETENFIRSENWEKAKISLDDSKKTWKQIKPMLQIDIDHDYVNNIEESFVKLDGYIDAREKGNSLATILLIQDEWDNIGSL